jgi:branched-chain amino acid transport system ATP-binding protein
MIFDSGSAIMVEVVNTFGLKKLALFELQKVSKNFGGLSAIVSLDLHAEKSEIVGLIGPNGAGKTTTFNLISGVYPPSSGTVLFEGKDITGMKTHKIAKIGIARVFQTTSLFREYTVLENVLTGFHLFLHAGLWSSVFPTRKRLENQREVRDRALEILSFLEITHLQNQKARTLSFGHQRLLSMATALALNPKLLMLDEPIGGLNPEEISMIVDRIQKIRSKKPEIAILMVEHNMSVVMSICDRIVVINFGMKIAEGSAEEVRSNPEVIKAYLGSSYAS